ncbi:MAG: hypothetical protein AB7R00_20565 [Kofleriaceae bacterium]
MRHALAALSLASSTVACSIIYDPGNIRGNDAAVIVPPDAYQPDADPTMFTVVDVGPTLIYEGQGEGGTRRAVLTLTGHHFAAPTVVSLVPVGDTPNLTVHAEEMRIAPSGDLLMVPVTIPIDTTRGEAIVAVTISVMQAEMTKTLEGKLQLQMLEELDDSDAITSVADLKALYSRVDRTMALTFPPVANAAPVIIRAVSSIKLGDVVAKAMGVTSGPGGKNGGASMVKGGGLGGGNPNLNGGGGGGYLFKGGNGKNLLNADSGQGGPPNGQAQIRSYDENSASGGGGGSGSIGGGGGGTVELTAGDTVEIASIDVSGAAGSAGSGLMLSGAGGGAGGTVVVRAQNTVTITGTVNVNGGGGGAGTTGTGGAGSLGRVRIDAWDVVGAGVPVTAHRGFAFDPQTPLFQRNPVQSMTGKGTATDQFLVIVRNAQGTATSPQPLSLVDTAVTLSPGLMPFTPGYNRVCVYPDGGAPAHLEALNCIELSYLP